MSDKLEITNKDISDSVFEEVNMARSQFKGINMVEAQLEDINLSDINVMFAQIGGAKFTCIGPPPDENGVHARQRPVRFEHATLVDSTFEKVNFENVKLIDCVVDGMQINGVNVNELFEAYEKQNS